MPEHNPPKLPPEHAKQTHPLWESIRFAIIAIPLIFLFRSFVAQPFVVRGASMEPTFQNSEYLIVYELPYHFRNPKRGDVVIFRYPNNPSQHYVKRIIGIPGDTVEINNETITIFNSNNPEGFVLEEPHILLPTHGTLRTSLSDTDGAEEFFVLGDNRTQSSDSRYWGPLPKDHITGRAILRLWPLGEAAFEPGNYSEAYDINQ